MEALLALSWFDPKLRVQDQLEHFPDWILEGANRQSRRDERYRLVGKAELLAIKWVERANGVADQPATTGRASKGMSYAASLDSDERALL